MANKFHLVPYIPIHGPFTFFMPLATSSWSRAQGRTHIGQYGVEEHLLCTHTPKSCFTPPLITPKRCLEGESKGTYSWCVQLVGKRHYLVSGRHPWHRVPQQRLHPKTLDPGSGTRVTFQRTLYTVHRTLYTAPQRAPLTQLTHAYKRARSTLGQEGCWLARIVAALVAAWLFRIELAARWSSAFITRFLYPASLSQPKTD